MENLCGENKTFYFGLSVAVCVSLPKHGTKQGSTAGRSLGKFNTSLFWAVFSTCHLDLSLMNGQGSLLSWGCLVLSFCNCLCTFPLQRLNGKCGMSIVSEAGARFLWPWYQARKHALRMAAVAYFCSKVSVLRIFTFWLWQPQW